MKDRAENETEESAESAKEAAETMQWRRTEG